MRRPAPPILLAWFAAFAGGLSIVSALTPEMANRLDLVQGVLPPGVPGAARTLVLALGSGMIWLSRGLARRKRRAWWLAVAVVSASAVAHLAKGLDFEEATTHLILLIGLFRSRRHFVAPGDPTPTDHGKPLAPGDLDHATGQEPKALVAAVLHRLIEQELVAEAHAKDRLAVVRQVHNSTTQSALRELVQGRRKRPDPRQYQAFGILQVFWVAGQLWLSPNLDKRTLDRSHVPDSVVDDGDHPSSPLDDGTPGPPPGDIASRSARPSALNVASAM